MKLLAELMFAGLMLCCVVGLLLDWHWDEMREEKVQDLDSGRKS